MFGGSTPKAPPPPPNTPSRADAVGGAGDNGGLAGNGKGHGRSALGQRVGRRGLAARIRLSVVTLA